MNSFSLLDIADATVPALAVAEAGIHPADHQVADAAGRKAYFTARGDGATLEEAKAKGEEAYRAALPVAPPAPPPGARKLSVVADMRDPSASTPPAPETHEQAIALGVDAEGLARSQADLARAVAAGFAPKATVYERGTRVIALGVENARQSRQEWEAMPLVTDACRAFEKTIREEERADVAVLKRDVSMLPTGQLTADDRTPVGLVTPEAFRSLCYRLGYGGARYLEGCPTPLRVHNVSTWRGIIGAAEDERAVQHAASDSKNRAPFAPAQVTLRTRTRPELKGEREVFAAVSKDYSPADGDKISEALRLAVERQAGQARGGVTYDGTRTRFDVLFQTTVQPEKFVAGEFFRAGAQVTTDDTGGGSVIVRACVFQNLCLNLLIIDRCSQPIARIRHIGSVEELLRKFAGAFKRALDAIAPFQKAWGYACEDDVVAQTKRASEVTIPDNEVEAMRGIFAGLVHNDLVHGPKKMPVGTVLEDLVAAWQADYSSAVQTSRTSRAAVVNAITRAAHTWTFEDPWAEDELQRNAGSLLWSATGRAPKALEYVEPDSLVARPAAAVAAS